MTDVYDKKSHWHACKREVLDKRLKKIKDGDYSEFFDYSSDFWLALCIAYYTLSYDNVKIHSNATRIRRMLNRLYDNTKDSKVYADVKAEAEKRGIKDLDLLKKAKKRYKELCSEIIRKNSLDEDDANFEEKLDAEGRKSYLQWELLKAATEKYNKIYYGIRSKLDISEIDDLGISVDDDKNITALLNAASTTHVNKNKITRNHIDHSNAEIVIKDGKEFIKVPTTGSSYYYELPLNWLVSYVDALCVPQRFFRDGSNYTPYNTNDNALDTLGQIYRMYTKNMHLMSNILYVGDPTGRDPTLKNMVSELLTPTVTVERRKEIISTVEAKFEENVSKDKKAKSKLLEAIDRMCLDAKKLDRKRNHVIEALLNAAGTNMYAFNFESGFENKINSIVSSTSGLSTDEMNLKNNLNGMYWNGVNSREKTIRDCVVHPGRTKVFKDARNNYCVEFIDKYNSGGTSGVVRASLDSVINFLESPLFGKMTRTSITNSDVEGIRQGVSSEKQGSDMNLVHDVRNNTTNNQIENEHSLEGNHSELSQMFEVVPHNNVNSNDIPKKVA